MNGNISMICLSVFLHLILTVSHTHTHTHAQNLHTFAVQAHTHLGQSSCSFKKGFALHASHSSATVSISQFLTRLKHYHRHCDLNTHFILIFSTWKLKIPVPSLGHRMKIGGLRGGGWVETVQTTCVRWQALQRRPAARRSVPRHLRSV